MRKFIHYTQIAMGNSILRKLIILLIMCGYLFSLSSQTGLASIFIVFGGDCYETAIDVSVSCSVEAMCISISFFMFTALRETSARI